MSSSSRNLHTPWGRLPDDFFVRIGLEVLLGILRGVPSWKLRATVMIVAGIPSSRHSRRSGGAPPTAIYSSGIVESFSPFFNGDAIYRCDGSSCAVSFVAAGVVVAEMLWRAIRVVPLQKATNSSVRSQKNRNRARSATEQGCRH